MSKYRDILENALEEAKAPETSYVSKGLYNETGRKIQGERKGKYAFFAKKADGTLTQLTWNQYKKIQAPSTNSEYVEKEFRSALINTIKQFNRKVDANMAVQNLKKSGGSFEEIVDVMIKNGAKYTKRGLTH